jgi:hypothetical protein
LIIKPRLARLIWSLAFARPTGSQCFGVARGLLILGICAAALGVPESRSFAGESPGPACERIDEAPFLMTLQESREMRRNAEALVHGRLMCIQGASNDDPLCWSVDPLGTPLPRSHASRAQRELTYAASFRAGPVEIVEPELIETHGGGPCAGYSRGIERPPRIVS